MKIKDNSNDKKYFTIIPNYVLNHSSAIDQSLYIQMKRLTGDGEGVCYASEKYFRDKLKIGRNALKNSIKYLIDHKWIEEYGERDVETKGGTQKVKTYLVKDIWKQNIEHYKGVSQIAPLTDKGVSEMTTRGVPNESKGVSQMTTKKNVREEELKNVAKLVLRTNNFIELFKAVNPSYEQLFKNKTQRGAIERLVRKHGEEKLANTIKALPQIINRPFAPRITTPLELERDLGKLLAFYNQEKGKVVTSKFSFSK